MGDGEWLQLALSQSDSQTCVTSRLPQGRVACGIREQTGVIRKRKRTRGRVAVECLLLASLLL